MFGKNILTNIDWGRLFENKNLHGDSLKSFQVFDRSIQKEAIINEFKGNVFEYMVGERLARHFNLEESYFQSLPGTFRQQLKSYEQYIRSHDPELLRALPKLASAGAESILAKLEKAPEGLSLVGKLAAGSHDRRFAEADLILWSQEKIQQLVSLKLCKEKAFVNTKSAGVKSFLSRYFIGLPDIEQKQAQLTQTVDEEFYKMGLMLYQMADLEFAGSFGPEWSSAGYSELPGELPPEMRKLVQDFYTSVIQKIYFLMKEQASKFPQAFASGLYPLCGLGLKEMLQVSCFHGTQGKSRYHLKSIHTFDQLDMEKALLHWEIGPLHPELSSFEIVTDLFALQIRIKPMNKFTTASYKVNCSLKHYGST